MQSLHHDVSPWQADLMGLRAVTHAAQGLRKCHTWDIRAFMAHGGRVDERNPPGVFWQMPFFVH
jgi:hypothetical protein